MSILKYILELDCHNRRGLFKGRRFHRESAEVDERKPSFTLGQESDLSSRG